MKDGKAPNNVIPFPSKRKPLDGVDDQVPGADNGTPSRPKVKKGKPSRGLGKTKTLAGSVLAIALATGATNRVAFHRTRQNETTNVAFVSTEGGRSIASIGSAPARDARWEMELAESLASTQVVDQASLGVGRPATASERLRWGVLEEKYTILYKAGTKPGDPSIESIELQNPESTNPAYVQSRVQFLREFGTLLSPTFAGAELKSTERMNGKTFESYVVFGENRRPCGQARFELDRHMRLLSLKFAPVTL